MSKKFGKRASFESLRKILYSFLIVAFCAGFGFSQTRENCFRGAIKDASGAVIAGAEIQLKNALGKSIEQTKSDAAGEFALPCFASGEYVLAISSEGMTTSETKIQLSVNDSEVTDIVMETLGVSETVNVEIEPQFVASASETATKTATPLRDVPQSVETVNRSLLDAQAAFSLKDALQNVTAISVAQGEGRRDQFFIRGFAATGDQFIDGVRDDAQYYRDLSNVEQIEVVKGPAAVLFGRGSSGGIINRQTKKPNVYSRVGSAEINFGSYGLKRASFDFGQPVVRDKLAFRFVGAYQKSGSFRHNFFQKSFNVAPSLAWKPTAKTDVVFQFEYLNDERLPDRGIPALNNRPLDVPIGTYYGFPALDSVKNKVDSQAVRVEHQANSFWTVRNVFRRTNYDTRFYNTPPNGICLFFTAAACTTLTRANTPRDISANDTRLRVMRTQYNGASRQKNYFNQTEAVGIVNTFGVQHTILSGVELGSQTKTSKTFRNSIADRVSVFNPNLTAPRNNGIATTDNDFTGNVFGVFVQDQIAFNKNWKALIGIRYDNFKQKIDDFLPANVDLKRIDKQLSPRAGVVYQPNEQFSFYASYTRSFQPSGENLSLAANAAQLEPELTRNYEGGVKAQFQPLKLNATLAVFRLKRDNIKTADPQDATKLILVGEQRTDGIELTVSGSPARKLDFVAGYALLDARITKSNTVSSGVLLRGKFAQLTPRNSGNLWLNYQLPKQLVAGFGFTARTKTFTSANNLITLPGYARFDASLAWRGERHYEIAFNLKNITNRRYYETSNGDNGIQPGAPINGSITMRYRW